VKTGRNLSVDALTVEKVDAYSVEAVEKQTRQSLEQMGHTLPWDNTDNRLGRPGPGVPFTRLKGPLRATHEWDEHGNLVKKGCK